MKRFYQLEMNGHQCGTKSAYVAENDKIIALKSYNTIIAFINKKTKKVYIRDYYSATSARHLNRFLNEYGYQPIYKKDYSKYAYSRSWMKIVLDIVNDFNIYAI